VLVPEVLRQWMPAKYKEKLPFVKPAPIDLEESVKQKKQQAKSGGKTAGGGKGGEKGSETKAGDGDVSAADVAKINLQH